MSPSRLKCYSLNLGEIQGELWAAWLQATAETLKEFRMKSCP